MVAERYPRPTHLREAGHLYKAPASSRSARRLPGDIYGYALTSRELACVFLTVEFGGEEAARRLQVGHSTLKTHLKSAFRKMGAKNRTHLVWLLWPEYRHVFEAMEFKPWPSRR